MIRSVEKLIEIASNLDHWMRTEAWPLWWSAGRHADGLFYEALDFSGRPVAQNLARTRVQARQIYSFALAWKMGWRTESLAEKISQSLDRYMDTCLGAEGIPGMLVDIETGQLKDPQPNLYVTAFTLLALAQSRGLIGGQAHDVRIAKLLENIDKHLAYARHSGYRETLPATPTRLQNPHMHFYESLLCLYENMHDANVGDRAEDLLNFVRKTFFDKQFGVVQERVDTDMIANASEYEPGHSLEWVWLLGYRSRLFNVSLDPFAVKLYTSYYSSGIAEGMTPMCLTINHEPVDATCRLWSQTESLKAHMCIARFGPKELKHIALKRAVECAESIRNHWLNTECSGGFYDHFDADGALLARDIPGSMGYHLYVAIMDLTQTAEELKRELTN